MSYLVSLNDDNIVTDMFPEFYGGSDPTVWGLYTNGDVVNMGYEPPFESYFYSTSSNDGFSYNIIGDKYVGSYDSYLTDAVQSSFKLPLFSDAFFWLPNAKGDYKSSSVIQNTIGTMFGTVMTPKDAGNANWASYFRDRYGKIGMNKESMQLISNEISYITNRRLEDTFGTSMQNWGWDKNFYNLGNYKGNK